MFRVLFVMIYKATKLNWYLVWVVWNTFLQEERGKQKRICNFAYSIRCDVQRFFICNNEKIRYDCLYSRKAQCGA